MASELYEQIQQAPLPTLEHLLSKGTIMPFNCTNSGVRKLMFSTNLEQRLALMEPDVPYVGTGYEPQFGKYSSSFQVADENKEVVARVAKFSARPRDHYYLIMINEDHTRMSLIERSRFQHLNESFGYICDNSTTDHLYAGDTIRKGHVTHRSNAFDEHNNRMDGKNLLALFTCSEETMEDSIKISESCSKKLASPLVHTLDIMFSTNDIPLNLYGDANSYKVLPDIDEHTKNDILCAIRREKKEEAFYSQDFNRLSQIFMSDEKITVTGKLVDIDVYCNNKEIFDEIHYSQLARYYNEHMRMCQEIVDAVRQYCDPDDPNNTIALDYDLEVLYYDCLAELNGGRFINEKVYSGLLVKVTVVEAINAEQGDKLTNRYGGKGVISKVVPDYLMPKTYDGRVVDIEINICGVYGRENAGQLFESSYTYRAFELVKHLGECLYTYEDGIAEIIKDVLDFEQIVAPRQYAEQKRLIDGFATDEEVFEYLRSIVDDGMLYLSPDPASDTPSIHTIIALQERFPWIKQHTLLVPLADSCGHINYVDSRRPVACGYIYYYRLKQHSEEKFSVTSLSATNIKNENSRNKASKVYRAQFPRTPIRFGDMELGDLSHMGIELVVQMLMLYSSSPEARMLMEELMTGNPYNVDIKLDDNSTNISAQIFATYIKNIGLALRFYKTLKKFNQPLLKNPFEYLDTGKDFPHNPFIQYAEGEYVDVDKALERAENNRIYRYPFLRSPFVFLDPPDEILKRAEANQKKLLEDLAAAVLEEENT